MSSSASRVMKRPARSVQTASFSAASASKKRKGIVRQSPEAQAVLTALKAEVSQSTYGVLVALFERYQILDTSPSLQKHEELALQSASVAFSDIQDRLQDEAWEAQTKLTSVEAGLMERASKVELAQAELVKRKHEVSEAKLDMKISMKAIESARAEIKNVKFADKSSAGNPKLVSEKIRSLQAFEKEIFQPLKHASVKGAQGEKKIKHLRKVGNRFGFHDVLLNTTMPKVALKSIEKRQTFDRLVLDQMEAEFAKKQDDLENALKDEKVGKRSREAALQMAHARLVDAQGQREASASRLVEAEKSVALCRQSLEATRRDLRKFDKDSQKIVLQSTQLETRLGNFLDGPLDAFKKLELFLSAPSPLVKLPSCQTQSTEMRTALTRALTRVGTMTLPPTVAEMIEDEDVQKEHLSQIASDKENYAEEEELEETDKEEDW